jgi:outer membrane murein-binding lipoprotein Lpp
LSEEADKLLQCERCLSWSCIKCAKVNPKEYELFSRADIHWFCHDCQKPALDAVKSDKIIEDRCNGYLKIFTKRVEKVEQTLATKANNESVNKIDTNVKTLEMKVNGLAGDVSKLGDRCDLIYSDNVEKQKRIKNIVVRGLPESEDITDTDLVKEILTVLDIETTPTSVVRLGKKPEVPPPRNEAAAVDNDNTIANIKTRPLKIVLVSTETHTNIISRGPRVSNAQEVHCNPKNCFQWARSN